MNKTKRLLSWLLCMAIIISACPLSGLTLFSANAAETVASGFCGDNVTYTLDSDGLLTISGTGDMEDYPDRYYPWPDSESKVIISNGVTSIGAEVFRGHTKLTSITIPDSVTSIGYNAFYGCTGLTSITFPDSVPYISSSAFYNTAWYNNLSDGVVYAGKVLYDYKGTMPDNTEITIAEGTKSIGSYAFRGCTGLTSIIIPESVTSVGDYAFCECKKLKSILVINPNCDFSLGAVLDYGKVYFHSGGKIEQKLSVLKSIGYSYWAENFIPIHIGENFDTYKCTDVGKRFQKCKYCDETASVDDVPFLGHTVVYEKKESTCTQSGYEKWYCKDCGYNAETKTIGAKGHDKVKHNGKTANCTEDGYKAYVTCSRCDYTTKQVIPALGHDFSGPSKTNDDGTISYMCVNCGEYSTATIKDITGTKRLTQDNVDVLVAPVEMTASTVIASATGGKIVDKAGKEITDKNTHLATGMKVILGKTSVTISVAGDVDGSGDISVSDARLALRAAVKLDTLTDACFTSADVDFSGDISVSDARLILRAAVQLDDPKKAWIK